MVAGTKTSKSVIAITVTIATKNIQYVFERDTIFRDVSGLKKKKGFGLCRFVTSSLQHVFKQPVCVFETHKSRNGQLGTIVRYA